MINSIGTAQNAASILPKSAAATADSSFEQQLADALKKYLSSAGIDPGNVQISVAPAATGQKVDTSSGSRQLLVTVTTGTPGWGGATVTGQTATDTSTNTTTGPKNLPPSLGPIHIIQPDLVAPAASASAPVTPQNEADRYWAAQPKEVQALRKIEDPTEKRLKAWDLASHGYTIDVPIMVWEWDPQYTMELRKSYGYTWVPSALQDTVKIAPGLQMAGLASYDPNNPPPGSIRVNTDFV